MLKLPPPRSIHRLYSTFPFPSQPNPLPHQIFHLPKNASEEDIKNRYYELVRIYHPDKVGSSVSSEEAHARFQSIGNAYNLLRGNSSPDQSTLPSSPRDLQHEATTAARRAAHVRRHRELYQAGAVDDRWKDRVILFGVIGTIVLFVAQTAITRQEAMEEVMDHARFVRMDAGKNHKRLKALQDPRLAADQEDDRR